MAEVKQRRWRPVRGYETSYAVSNDGIVRSLPRTKRHPKGGVSLMRGKILKIQELEYPVVGLYRDGRLKRFFVHRLLYEAFRGMIPTGMQINHKDTDKYHCHLHNLEVVTQSENMQHAYRHGLVMANTTAANRACRTPVDQLDLNGTFIRRWDGIRSAGRGTGVDDSSILQACAGNYKTAGGFKWRKSPKDA